MDIYAELYFEVKFVENSLNHRDFTIPALSSSIASLSRHINSLETFIHLTLIGSPTSNEDYEDDYPDDIQTASIGVTYFKFSTLSETRNAHEYEFILPDSIKDRLLWYLDPVSTTFVSKETLQDYKSTFDHMNSVSTNVTVRVKKVEIHRRWLKPMLFSHSYFTLVSF